MSENRPPRRSGLEAVAESIAFIALLYAPLVYMGACAYCAAYAGGGQ